jgi:hypothetical protein
MHRLGSLTILFTFSAVAAFAGAPAGSAPAATAAPAAAAVLDGKTALERLKALAGTWEGTIVGPEKAPAKSIFSVTAGGTAVVEKMFPDTPHEMVTVYFLEGAALRVTHYCSAGNQPHMRFDARASTADDLRFAFDGGTGFDPKKDLHVHAARLTFSPDGALTEEWEFHNEGGKNGIHAMTLTRAAS